MEWIAPPFEKIETLVPVSADTPSAMVVITRHGAVIVPPGFPRRELKDNQMACGVAQRVACSCYAFLSPRFPEQGRAALGR